MTQALGGLWVPTSTPFKSNGLMDMNLFLGHCRTLLDEGAGGLAILGTTSEANSLSLGEREEQLDFLLDNGIPAERLMPGTGSCSLYDAIHLTSRATEAGCAGVLVLPPFYYTPVSDDGLFEYFCDLIESAGDDDLKVFLYHIPQLTDAGITLGLIERLLKRYPGTIAGLKDSSGDYSNTLSVIRNFPQLRVFPASEAFLLQGLRAGMAGCITASGNLNARAISELFLNWQKPEAEAAQVAVARRRKIVEGYPVVPATKAALAFKYREAAWNRMRPPLMSLDAARTRQLVAQLTEDGLVPVEMTAAA